MIGAANWNHNGSNSEAIESHAQGGQWELVKAHGLSTYDAAYLQLAMDLKAPLATFDEQLAKVANRVLGGE